MRKWIIAAAVLVLGYMDGLPFEHADAGTLCVAETLLVEADYTGVTLYSADGAGQGESIRKAAEDLKENVPGQLFLRQVKRMIFCGGAEEKVDLLEMPEEIPLGAHIYMYPSSADTLLEEFELEENLLLAREKRKQGGQTLAQTQNEVLKRYD